MSALALSRLLGASLALTLIAAPVKAQFVKGNEAVTRLADGSTRVETPPLPATGSVKKTKPCNANAGCHAGAWRMVETNEGLVECTESYARPNTCRTSSYGSKKALRIWVVKSQGKWLQCQFPNLESSCVEMSLGLPANLPYDAVQ